MNAPAPLVVIGDILLDTDICGTSTRSCPDSGAPAIDIDRRAQRPGGAGLAALAAAATGHPVHLVSAFADDAEAHVLQRLLAPHARVHALPADGSTTTKTRIMIDGHPVARLDDGTTTPQLDSDLPGESLEEVLGAAGAILVSDYGRGMTSHRATRAALQRLAPRVPIVWDPHPRGATPVPRCALVTPSEAEARGFAGGAGSPGEQARALRELWQADAVAVTLGARGATLAAAREAFSVAAPPSAPTSAEQDPCGAGDCFASAVAAALAEGLTGRDAIARAVGAATAYVRSGGARRFSMPATTRAETAPPAADGDALGRIAELRRSGARIVATGGCFDILHRGHLSLLEQARSLGDALVVCLNSDSSVRALKGASRPILGQDDRARALRALAVVDAVIVFDEATPRRLLRELRPDIWVKGGDYEPIDLAEADVIREQRGEIVIVPTVGGYSTTALLERLRHESSPHDDEERTITHDRHAR